MGDRPVHGFSPTTGMLMNANDLLFVAHDSRRAANKFGAKDFRSEPPHCGHAICSCPLSGSMLLAAKRCPVA